MVLIRKALPEDMLKIIKVNEACLPENYDIHFWSFLCVYGTCFVAELDKEIIGYIVGIKLFSPELKQFMEEKKIDEVMSIVSFAVMESHRNKGIGQQLMTTFLKEIGEQFVILHVRESNEAIKLYKKNGFVQYGEKLKGYYKLKKIEDGLLMTR